MEPKLGNQKREKLTHILGVVANVKYESTGDHEYTGMFQGGEYGILRLSSGQLTHDPAKGMISSFAMKLFRDQ